MERLGKTRSIALALVAATTVAFATPTLADSWRHPAAAAGLGFVAGTAFGAAIAQPRYAYAPAYGYVNQPAYAGAYAYAPMYGTGDYVVGDLLDGAPIYASELGPNCTFGQKQFEQC